MYSKRTKNTDSVSDEGILSEYIADGCMILMRRGDEYFNIFPVWNWQRIPGTTVTQNNLFDKKRSPCFGNTDFVGGVSDDQYGVATLDLSHTYISLKKSWFFFDDEVVALGCDIQSNDAEHSVVTTLNQCHQNGPAKIQQTDNKISTINQSDEKVYSSVKWVHHDDIGYVFPKNSDITMSLEEHTGSWKGIVESDQT